MAYVHRSLVGTALLAALLTSTSANAASQGITGKKLLLKFPSRVLVLLSKDPSISIAGSDPVGGADSSISFDNGSGPVTYSLPKTFWSTNGSGTRFKYKNPTPSSSSPVKLAKVKAGLLKMKADVDLPFAVPDGPATIDVVLSLDGVTNAYCMTFTGTGDGSKFLVKDASAGACPRTCCDLGSICSGSTVFDCANSGGSPAGSDKVCDATANCVSGAGTPGGCCEFLGGAGCVIVYPGLTQNDCETFFGGVFHASATCLPSGACSP